MNSPSPKLVEHWLKAASLADSERTEIQAFNEAERSKRFRSPIAFGLAGLRVPIGMGSNFFNRHTIKQLVLATVRVLKTRDADFSAARFVVFRDSRANSAETALLIADILSSFGILVDLFSENKVAPTPFLVHLLTQKKREYGFIVTASHQTKEINGCKLFVKDKGIANARLIKAINKEIQKNHLDDLNFEIKPSPELIRTLDSDFKKEYLLWIKNKLGILSPSERKTKITYSSIHGCGIDWTDLLLRKAGYEVSIVEKQCELNSEFPTVKDPNPENDHTFDLALSQAKQEQSDLIILNDVDVDRMRVAARYNGEFQLFSGNEIATIFIYFLVNELKRKGIIYMTFVSTNLIYKIGADYGCAVKKTLTGFANLARKYNEDEKSQFLFAFEESIGFLPNRSITNDKDGIQAAFLISEIANFLKKNNKTLSSYLDEIYQKYGYFSYTQVKFKLDSDDKLEQILQEVAKLKEINGLPVKKITNYFNKQNENPLYQIFFNNDCWVGCRPSVTEPIFKFYFVSRDKIKTESLKKLNFLKTSWIKKFEKIKNSKN